MKFHEECQDIFHQSNKLQNSSQLNPSSQVEPSTKISPRRRPQPNSPLYPGDNVYFPGIAFVSSPSRRQYVGTFSPALRAYGWQCPQLSGANSDRDLSPNPLAATGKLTPPQRSTTSSSKGAASEAAASPFRLTVAGTVTTAVAVGSMAWYYHLYGPTLYAMTPQEEGYNYYLGIYQILC